MNNEQQADKIISKNVNEALGDQQLKELSKIAEEYLNSTNLDINQEQFEAIVNLMSMTAKVTAKHSVIATINTINEMQNVSEQNVSD